MLTILLALALLAQALNPARAYTTADPINPDRLGLATPDGRYMIEFGMDCGIVAGVNVVIGADYPLTIVTVDDTRERCAVQVDQRMSNVPCFQIDGVCDVAAEADE